MTERSANLIDWSLVAQNLRTIRMLRRISQEELALKAGVSVRTVSRTERGQPVRTRSLAKICDALNLPFTEATTIKRFGNVKWPQIPLVTHDPENTVWYTVEDYRRNIPEDSWERIQDSRERLRLGQLGLVPMFTKGLSFIMPRGPGITLFEVYGPIKEGIRSTLYQEVVFYCFQGDVVFTIGEEKIRINEGGAIGCDNSSIVGIDLPEPIGSGGKPALVMYIGSVRIAPFPSHR